MTYYGSREAQSTCEKRLCVLALLKSSTARTQWRPNYLVPDVCRSRTSFTTGCLEHTYSPHPQSLQSSFFFVYRNAASLNLSGAVRLASVIAAAPLTIENLLPTYAMIKNAVA